MLGMKCLILAIVLMQIEAESRTVTSMFKYDRAFMKSQQKMEMERSQVKKCSELPTVVLSDILGAAFNSRFDWFIKSANCVFI